jgi:hypothetical protein
LSFGNAAKALFFLQVLREAGFIIWKWAKNVLLRKSKLMTFIVTQQSRKIQTSRQDTSTIGTLQDHVIYNTKIRLALIHLVIMVVAIQPKDKEILEIGIGRDLEKILVCLEA